MNRGDSVDGYRLSFGGFLRGILVPIAANWQWVAGCVLVFGAAFTGFALLVTPAYQAETVLLPAGADKSGASIDGALGQLSGLAALAGVSIGGGDKNTEEAIAVLKSKEFTERFITDNDLLPVLFPRLWDATQRRWKVGAAKQPTLGRAYRRFDEQVRSVIQDKKTGLVTIQVEWRDRFVAAKWANELVARLNAEMRKRAISRASANIAFLEKELESTAVVSTRDAIGRLLDAQVRQRMVATVSDDFAFRVVDAAVIPDADDPIRPKKTLLIVLGPLLGFLFAVGVIGIVRTFSGVEANGETDR